METDLDRMWREGSERWAKMTTAEIAVELGTSVEALYRWARLGRIPGLTQEFLDERRRLDPLREFDRGRFDPVSGLIPYEHAWKPVVLKRLRRFLSLEDLIERAFIRGEQGRHDQYLSIRICDRLAFFSGTTALAVLDCQRTWFVVEPEDLDDPELREDLDLVTDYIDGYHEEPYRIRPSLYFLNVEAVQEGLMKRWESGQSAPEDGPEDAFKFEDLMDLAEVPWDWPEEAGALVLEVMQNPEAPIADRVLAARFAGDYCIVNDELVEALLAIVRSDSEPVELRSQAAISFGPALEVADMEVDFGDPDGDSPISADEFHRLKEALRALFRDAAVPEQVRRCVLEAAVRASEDWHQAAVRTAWSTGHDGWMRTAAFCMGYVKGFKKDILEALVSEDPAIRYHAICAAGGWELKGAWKHIAPLVSSGNKDKALLIAAIEAVANIRPEEAPDLLEALEDIEDEDVQEAVADALLMANSASDLESDLF